MIKPNIILRKFEPVLVTQPIPQPEVLEYMAWLLATAQCSKDGIQSEEKAELILNQMSIDVQRYGVSPKYISKRELNAIKNVFCHEKMSFTTEEFPEIFENILENYQGKDINSRLIQYEKIVYSVMEKWYTNLSELPDDIIHATCTGYISPSPIQKLLSNKGLSEITVTHSYQMGCYGAIPPLRMAVGFLTSNYVLEMKKKKVDILHTEYSSLHFQAIHNLPDQIVSMSLFGDGFIKYSVFIEDANSSTIDPGLKVLAALDKIIPSTLNEMSLIPGAYSFEMWLSKNVPLKVKDEIYSFVESLCNQMKIDFNDIKDNAIFALHPGGPKILDHIKERLNINEQQIRFSRKVLYEHGNMVSCTLPYIWREIINDGTILPGTKIISIAFGPGITIAGFILEKVG